MASLSVHLEELHDLPQQRGTREKRSLGDWSHYGVEVVPVFVTGDSGTFAGETEFAAAIAAAKKHLRHLLRQQQVNKET